MNFSRYSTLVRLTRKLAHSEIHCDVVLPRFFSRTTGRHSSQSQLEEPECTNSSSESRAAEPSISNTNSPKRYRSRRAPGNRKSEILTSNPAFSFGTDKIKENSREKSTLPKVEPIPNETGSIPPETQTVENLPEKVESLETEMVVRDKSEPLEILEPKELEDIVPDVPGLPGPLDSCTEDVSGLTENYVATFNVAAIADKSELVQKLVDLGVDFYQLEKSKKYALEHILRLDFQKDVKPYIVFLHDCGVAPDKLGEYFTKNPLILQEELVDLETRVKYLRMHKFTSEMIQRIITSNPYWLMFSVKQIDERLGYFQGEFHLSGQEVRSLAVALPKLITYKMQHVIENTFAVREEMGFSKIDTKSMILSTPRIWIMHRKKIVQTFDYLHNTMKLPHELIVLHSNIMLYRKSRLEPRHRFLVELKRNQYDPTKPKYVSPLTLVSGTDADFCRNVAEAALETYNAFLKTL